MSIREGVLLAFLSLNTISDVKTKKILMWSAWAFGIFGLLYRIVSKDLAFPQTLIMLIPGIVFLAIGNVTKEAMGYGDGIVVLIMGVYTGMQTLISSLMLALLFAALWALVLMVFFKKRRQEEFPFVPFILLGYLGGLLI